MEDFYDVKMSKIDGQTVCLFGIFDGWSLALDRALIFELSSIK